MWIQYALFGSFLWAVVHILDEHCVDTGQSAVKMGVPSLVSAIEASIPAFAVGISLTAMLRRKVDAQTKRKLRVKWMMVALMMVGVWLIGTGIEA